MIHKNFRKIKQLIDIAQKWSGNRDRIGRVFYGNWSAPSDWLILACSPSPDPLAYARCSCHRGIFFGLYWTHSLKDSDLAKMLPLPYSSLHTKMKVEWTVSLLSFFIDDIFWPLTQSLCHHAWTYCLGALRWISNTVVQYSWNQSLWMSSALTPSALQMRTFLYNCVCQLSYNATGATRPKKYP